MPVFSDKALLDAIYSDGANPPIDRDLRSYFSRPGHVGFAISEENLRLIDFTEDNIFEFLKPEFDELWSYGVGWADLSHDQQERVLEAIWRDQDNEIWAAGIFASVLVDHLGRSAFVLYSHSGDDWDGEGCHVLATFQSVPQLEAFVKASRFLHLFPGTSEMLADRTRQGLRDAPAVFAKAQRRLQREARLTAKVKDTIAVHVLNANWVRLTGHSLAPMGNDLRHKAIERYVTNYFLEYSQLPSGAHAVPMNTRSDLEEQETSNHVPSFEVTFPVEQL